MQINLDPETEAIIQAKFESGLYVSRSEVVREALRLMIRRDALMVSREVPAGGQTEQSSASGEEIPEKPEFPAAFDLDTDSTGLGRRSDRPGTDVPR